MIHSVIACKLHRLVVRLSLVKNKPALLRKYIVMQVESEVQISYKGEMQVLAIR